uniref:Uncharacterized protein n=1 Tax=Anguilla anguilla TaxID=7936 RepID=A0A0E9QAM0_ANGAN
MAHSGCGRTKPVYITAGLHTLLTWK